MLKIYSTLSGKKEEFSPRNQKKAMLFVCGPTVYDLSHLGHARTYIAFDAICKYLRQVGCDVFYLQNITDIDDKIINRAKESGQRPKDLAARFENEYMKDMQDLRVDSVTLYARATGHIKEILSQVERLIEKGFAYRIDDGIYYDISKFKNYGKLSKRSVNQAEDAISRIDEGKNKKNKGDFCLWKFSKPGEPSWASPWGKGRPGWHIEDTAICEKYFGLQYDIHGGARDLVFPHHEAEIAQMEGLSGKSPLAKYWMHTGFLTILGRKMSKSLGNFITIRKFLKENQARVLRFFVLKNHYRSPIDYSENEVELVKNQLMRFDEFVDRLKNVKASVNVKNERKIDAIISRAEKQFYRAMDDDFNTPVALASLYKFLNEANSLIDKNKIDPNNSSDILNFLRKIDKFFCLDLTQGLPLSWRLFGEKFKLSSAASVRWSEGGGNLPDKIMEMVTERENYRREGKWNLADETRKKIQRAGYEIEDTKDGPKIKKSPS